LGRSAAEKKSVYYFTYHQSDLLYSSGRFRCLNNILISFKKRSRFCNFLMLNIFLIVQKVSFVKKKSFSAIFGFISEIPKILF
jgi:hypothetical protein